MSLCAGRGFDLGATTAKVTSACVHVRPRGRDPRATGAGGDTSWDAHRPDGRPLDGLRVEHNELGLIACVIVNEPDEPAAVVGTAAVWISDENQLARGAAVAEVVPTMSAGEQVVLVRRARADSPEETLRRPGLPPVARRGRVERLVEHLAVGSCRPTIQRPPDEGRPSGIRDHGLRVRIRARDVPALRVDLKPDRLRIHTRPRGQADEPIGDEHDIVAGEFELPDPARRVVDRPDRPRQSTSRHGDMHLRPDGREREEVELASVRIDLGVCDEAPACAGEINAPNGVESGTELVGECPIAESKHGGAERDEVGGNDVVTEDARAWSRLDGELVGNGVGRDPAVPI